MHEEFECTIQHLLSPLFPTDMGAIALRREARQQRTASFHDLVVAQQVPQQVRTVLSNL